MTIGTDQDVLGLEVTVDDTSCMQPFNTLNYLRGVKTGSIPAKPAPSCQLGGEVTSRMEVLSLD